MPSWTHHGPISLKGSIKGTDQQTDQSTEVTLRVVNHPDQSSVNALVNPDTLALFSATQSATNKIRLEVSGGSDCIITAVADANIPPGALALTATQQHNHRVLKDSQLTLTLFNSPERCDLVDLEAEVSVLGDTNAVLHVDYKDLSKRFLSRYLGHVLAVNEACVFEWDSSDKTPSIQLLVRIQACNTLDEQEQEEIIGYHCYRGLLTPDTLLYFVSSASSTISGDGEKDETSQPQSTAAIHGQVFVVNAKERPTRKSANILNIMTNDGEVFPVKKKLLRPCIALTSIIRSDDAASKEGDDIPSEVSVDIDTLTFDRVLIYLECAALNKQLPSFGIHLIPDLLTASQKLGLGSLEDYCATRLNQQEAKVKWHRFEDIKKRNNSGECLLIMNGGMVLDVTRWLPEHPGGDKIIPAQALNIDCSRMFEVYHASRESFLYIKEFYIGEVVEEDLQLVPQPKEPPSDEFLAQLREFTDSCRLKRDDAENIKVFKSF